MKKLILPLLAVALLTVGCGKKNPSESGSTPKTSESTPSGQSESTPKTSESGKESESHIDGGDDPDRLQTYYFYLDYSHSDTPLYAIKWWQYQPLGECPEKAKLTDADAADPLFPKFLGYSLYSSSLDDSKIWDFAKDSTARTTVKLYGIWVAND